MKSPSSPHWIVFSDNTDCDIGDSWGPRAPTIEVIAHSLSQINRFTGHARRPYSVAEHSLLCLAIAAKAPTVPPEREFQLCCLFHDAAESLIGDASSPLKQVLGTSWTKLEHAADRFLQESFGLRQSFQKWHYWIKLVDLTALWIERRDLLSFDPETQRPWPIDSELFTPLTSSLSVSDGTMPWHFFRDGYINEFRRLAD